MATGQVYHATGKRKTSIARVYLRNGSGQITINERPFEEYFQKLYQPLIRKPMKILEVDGKYDVSINVEGGGFSSQADACMYGVAKALTLVSAKNRPTLKKAELLTRDSRIVESKKYGHKKARRSFQFSKR
jgi:small subunit ribosomal protein S9